MLPMALVSPCSSSFFTVNNNSKKSYDVFLSFRGKDTRGGITSHIYKALADDKKIKTYMDEKSLEIGDEISSALLAGIQNSKISVIVFSEHYATSPWCLNELVHINNCRKNRGQMVVPIFYNVDPCNVRAQYEGSYKAAFDEHENNPQHSAETVQEWRSALKEIGSIAGYHHKHRWSESTLVKEVVETILKKLGRPATRRNRAGEPEKKRKKKTQRRKKLKSMEKWEKACE